MNPHSRHNCVCLSFVPQSLDIQYTVGVATGVPTTLYSVGDSSSQGFIDIVNFLLGLDELPLVLTTSYGFNESDFEGSEDFAK